MIQNLMLQLTNFNETKFHESSTCIDSKLLLDNWVPAESH